MKIKSLLNADVKKMFSEVAAEELYASHLYQHFSNHCQRLGLFGSQKYFKKESGEELNHYQKLADYVNDMGDVLDVPAVPTVSEKVEGISDCLEMAYEFEVSLMKLYQKFYDKAEDSGDCVTATFILDFLNLQRTSVGEYGDLIARLQLAPNDLLEFDEYMGEQV